MTPVDLSQRIDHTYYGAAGTVFDLVSGLARNSPNYPHLMRRANDMLGPWAVIRSADFRRFRMRAIVRKIFEETDRRVLTGGNP